MILIIICTIFGICMLCLFCYINWCYSYWNRRGFPFVPPTFPYGNLNGSLDQKCHDQFAIYLDRFYKYLKGQGPIGGVYFLWKPFAVILDIDLIKQILITDFAYFEDRGTYYNEKDDPLSAHILAVDSDRWRPLRRKLSPAFTLVKMRYMFPTVIKVAENLTYHIQQLIENGCQDNQDIDIYELVSRFTTDVIGTCAFGIECNSLANYNDDFRIMGKRSISDRQFPFPMTFFLSSMSQLARSIGIKPNKSDLIKFFIDITRETVEYRQKKNIKRNDFMDILISMKNDRQYSITMNEIAAQVFLFFIAGFDTSATVMAYALYEMALNRKIQKRAQCEIQQTLDKHNGQFTFENIMKMDYLNQIINETLRKHPPIGQLIRKVNCDYRIPGTQLILPKGTVVFIPIYSIHRDPEHYANPNKFIPERFSLEKTNQIFFGFGDGPRNCIGKRFGQMQVCIGLARLLENYEFTVCPKTENTLKYLNSSIMMTPENGIWLNVKKIK